MRQQLVIDAIGLKCPLPVLKAETMLARLKPGEGFALLASDPVARIDVIHFCKGHGHQVDVSTEGNVTRFAIVKGPVR